MKFSTALSFLATASSTIATNVSYDTTYDNGANSLTTVSCSDGANGLITKYGWSAFSDIPTSNIGGWEGIAGWNSEQCGTCLSVEYNGNTIYVLAIDHADTGLNIAEAALNTLTNGNAEQLGHVDAAVTPVDVSNCGLTPSKRAIAFNS